MGWASDAWVHGIERGGVGLVMWFFDCRSVARFGLCVRLGLDVTACALGCCMLGWPRVLMCLCAQSSGVAVADAVVGAFHEIKTGHKHRFAIFKLSDDLKEIVIDTLAPPSATYDDLLAKLSPVRLDT